jgi:hypothetical protein
MQKQDTWSCESRPMIIPNDTLKFTRLLENQKVKLKYFVQEYLSIKALLGIYINNSILLNESMEPLPSAVNMVRK